MDDPFRAPLHLLLAASLCGAAALPAGGGVVLSPRAAAPLYRQCSRAGPIPGEGYWKPAAGDLAALEASLPRALAAERARGVRLPDLPLAAFGRQYVAVVRGGRRMIYVNGFPAQAGDDTWRRQAVVVCDGGPAFFGAEYDVTARRFVRFDFNGPLPSRGN